MSRSIPVPRALPGRGPRLWRIGIGALLGGIAVTVHAGVLPEERADAMWSEYHGGGLKVQGPSILVRKNFSDEVSVSAGYLVDQVSGASIDMVVLGASRASCMGVLPCCSKLWLHSESHIALECAAGSDNRDRARGCAGWDCSFYLATRDHGES